MQRLSENAELITNIINLSNLLYPNFRERSSSWEAKRPSAGQEIPYILWNLKVPYRIQKRLPPVPILSQSQPVRASPFHLLNMYFNITFPALLFCPNLLHGAGSFLSSWLACS